MRYVHCLNKISEVALKTLRKTYPLTDDATQAAMILVRSANMHEMPLSPSVMAVARAGSGYNNIPVETYGKQGIVVFNTPGANANAVKELTIAGMLLASRGIYDGMKWVESNKDQTEIHKTIEKVKNQFAGTEIFGKTIGVIGLGAVGMKIAKACNALGMKVYSIEHDYDLFLETCLSQGISLVKTFDEFYPYCDFISINVPLNDQTRHMINKQTIKQMKDGVIILNFARDALVNDEDIEEALASKKVRAYVTDFPNDKTAGMSGVIAIPHLGASTEEAEDNCALMAIDQCIRYIESGVIKNSVNYPDLSLGPSKTDSRIIILHDADIDISKLIETHLKQVTIHQYASGTKGGFGCYLADIEHPINQEVLDEVAIIDGIYNVRVI